MDPRAVALQISPPSSPDIDQPVRKPSPEDVSPIDDEFDMAQQELIRGPRPTSHGQPLGAPKAQPSPPRSNIPTMRRDRRKQQEAALSSRRDTRPRDNRAPPVQSAGPSRTSPKGIPRSDGMRWDRDGSPTFGRGSLSPAPPGELPLGSTTVISGPARSPRNQPSPSFGERVRQFGIGKTKPEPLESRPAWNGASGRSNPVQPLRDNPNVAPLQAPPKSAKRAGRGGRGVPTNGPTTPGQDETTGPATSNRRTMPYNKATQQQQPKRTGQSVEDYASRAQNGAVAPTDEVAHSYPSPPYSGSPMRMSPETALSSQAPTSTANDSSAAQLPVPPIVIPHAEKAIKRKPPPAHSNPTHAAQGSLSTKAPQQSVPAAQDNDDGWVQPPSRFSISTRATSHTGSPRPSDDEERPPLPEAAAQTSVMDRRRPRYDEDESNDATAEPIVISVKPFSGLNRKGKASHNSPMPAPQRRKTGSVDVGDGRPLSVMSTSKALPPAPPELSSQDRVGHLNARLDDLAHRRNNINRSIKQMTELMPADRLMASAEVLRKREIERMKVDNLKQELAEVQQEEYELGLKLHRAYKRLEREAEFEPTGLWVKRVTSY